MRRVCGYQGEYQRATSKWADAKATDGRLLGVPHLRGAVAPRSGDDLEALPVQRPHKQGRENPLCADAVGQFLQGCILEDMARVGGGLGQDVEGKVAVLGCVFGFMVALLVRLGVRVAFERTA